ncbi:MAG: ComEA family DNA-binding protein [Micrococcales bacterium]|nr:ComEA family DNA-binding protein [Micrococcales bacterium]
MDQANDVLARLRLRATLTEAANGHTARHRGDAGPHLGPPVASPGVRGLRPQRLGRFKVTAKAGLAVALALVVLLVAVLAWRSSAGTGAAGQEIGLTLSPPPQETATALIEPTSAAVVMVYVVGAVHQPGVVQLPVGSRVIDALEKAGGAMNGADLAVLNLAAVVVDGERIFVPLPGQTPPVAIGFEGGSTGNQPGLVNVNQASAEQLTDLPGIGPVLAGRIVDYREAHGPFGDIADLSLVSGIGPKLTASLEDLVAF